MGVKLGRCQCVRVSALLPPCMREATDTDGLCDKCRTNPNCVRNRARLRVMGQGMLAARIEDRLQEWKEMRRGGG